MTVAELIETLKQFSPSAEVEYSSEDGEIPIDDVEEEDGVVYLMSDDDDDEAEEDPE